VKLFRSKPTYKRFIDDRMALHGLWSAKSLRRTGARIALLSLATSQAIAAPTCYPGASADYCDDVTVSQIDTFASGMAYIYMDPAAGSLSCWSTPSGFLTIAPSASDRLYNFFLTARMQRLHLRIKVDYNSSGCTINWARVTAP